MLIAYGLMHRCSQDFGLGGGLNSKLHAMESSENFGKRDFLWDKKRKIKSCRSDIECKQDLLNGKDKTAS